MNKSQTVSALTMPRLRLIENLGYNYYGFSVHVSTSYYFLGKVKEKSGDWNGDGSASVRG